MGDQPRRDRADERGIPGRSRARADRPGAQPVTVEQLLARQDGTGTGRRRATRRADAAQLRAPDGPPPGSRDGLPSVPGAPAAVPGMPDAARPRPPQPDFPTPRGGTPPVPSFARPPGSTPPVPPLAATPSRPVPPLPSRPGAAGSALPDLPPGVRPSRPVAPLPPIPGRPPGGERAPRNHPVAGFAHRAKRRATATPGRRRLFRAVVAVAAVVALVALYHLGLYFYVDRSIARVDALATDGPEILAPQLQADTQNYVVVGTGVPGQQGPASVSTLVVSVDGEGGRAVLVSVPPTAMVDTPACRTREGALRPPTTEAFADTLLDGGPGCLVRAVQQLSGLRVDHYLAVDLDRLPGLVDALGGVSVCVPASAAVAASAAPLPAGRSELTGAAATGYLTPGDAGSDVTGAAVAERAQLLLTATLRGALSTGTLADTPRLTRFLSRASAALTVDDETTLGDLRGLASALGGLSGDGVQRAGLPVASVGYVPAGSDQAFVLVDGVASRTLFDTVIDRTRLPDDVASGDAAAAPSAEAQPADTPAPAAPVGQPLTAAPAGITVDVLNGTGTTGLAAQVGDQLRTQGFGVGTLGNEAGTVNQTLVRYGPATAEQARTVAAAVPGSVLQPSDAIGDAVQLVIGPGFTGVVPVTPGPPAADTPTADAAAAAPTTAEPTATAPACG